MPIIQDAVEGFSVACRHCFCMVSWPVITLFAFTRSHFASSHLSSSHLHLISFSFSFSPHLHLISFSSHLFSFHSLLGSSDLFSSSHLIHSILFCKTCPKCPFHTEVQLATIPLIDRCRPKLNQGYEDGHGMHGQVRHLEEMFLAKAVFQEGTSSRAMGTGLNKY